MAAHNLIEVYCSYCRGYDDKDRIFLANPHADICYCPNCGKAINPVEGAKAYKNKIDSLLKKANFIYSYRTNYLSSYKMYGYILSLDKDNIFALCGRFESLIRMSSISSPRLVDVTVMLADFKKTKKFFTIMEGDCLLGFFMSSYHSVKRYLTVLKKRLFLKNKIFDTKSAEFFAFRLFEAINYFVLVKDILSSIEKSFNCTKIKELNDLIDKANHIYETFLSKELVLVNGRTIRFIVEHAKNNIEIEEVRKRRVDERILNKYGDDKIPVVFRGKDKVFFSVRSTLAWSIVFVILASLFFLFSVYNIVTLVFHQDHRLFHIIALAVSGCLSCFCFFARYIANKYLAKKHII